MNMNIFGYLTKKHEEAFPQNNSQDSDFYELTRLEKILMEGKATAEDRRCYEEMAYKIRQSTPYSC